MRGETRTPAEIFDDMLADDCTLDEIAEKLGWTYGQARQRYMVVCGSLGVTPDAEYKR